MAAEQENSERTIVQRRDPLLSEVLDRRFRVEARIAAGGFGAIYRATHLKSGHQFALKVLHPTLTNDSGVVARFRREGAALTLLRDPHTINAYELGEADDGTLYIVMELLRGESLYERFRARGALPWQSVVAIGRAVCSSLAEAHALGIIHRDLKPTNIHLEPRGNEQDFVKVLDFGIAKILQDSDIDSSDLTQAGQMIGTLDYMSPEQMVGGMCEATSDIYTLGVVMYEMIAGGKPFKDANSPAAALAAVLTMTPPRLSTQAVVPADLDRLVMRCLERQPTDRYQSAIDLAAALDEILPGVDEVVTRVAAGTPHSIPGIPVPPAGDLNAPNAVTDPDAHPVDGDAMTAGSNALMMDADTVLANSNAATDPDAVPLDVNAVTQRNAVVPAKPVLVNRKSAPVIGRPAPSDFLTTLPGHMPADRAGSIPMTPQAGMPQVAAPAIRSKNLREAYPTIHRSPPSPTRPPRSKDDRSASSVTMVPFDMARAVRRDAMFRRLAMAIGLAVAIIVAFLVASRL